MHLIKKVSLRPYKIYFSLYLLLTHFGKNAVKQYENTRIGIAHQWHFTTISGLSSRPPNLWHQERRHRDGSYIISIRVSTYRRLRAHIYHLLNVTEDI